MFKRIAAFFNPLATIAAELTAIRELYEEELSQRKPPIYRITGKPSKDDTEISYMGEPPAKKGSALSRIKEVMSPDDYDEEEYME